MTDEVPGHRTGRTSHLFLFLRDIIVLSVLDRVAGKEGSWKNKTILIHDSKRDCTVRQVRIFGIKLVETILILPLPTFTRCLRFFLSLWID
ncbi:MAG: hypothetical protein D3910_29025 [Candidatus Electrothrix sp. ATG2]|nr:hypothetical protein [Candidatus Electrothrix sp. ATG2]